jgi:hypothetical protein
MNWCGSFVTWSIWKRGGWGANYVIPLAIRLQSVPVYVGFTGTDKIVYEGSFTVPGNHHSLAKVDR